MHQVRPRAQVVIHGRQLQHLAQQGDGPLLAQVLVADDGFADGFGLRLRGRSVLRGLEQVERDDGAGELEGE
jgi:hypothetical protein